MCGHKGTSRVLLASGRVKVVFTVIWLVNFQGALQYICVYSLIKLNTYSTTFSGDSYALYSNSFNNKITNLDYSIASPTNPFPY